MFTHTDQTQEYLIQTSEFDFRSIPGDRATRFDFGYRPISWYTTYINTSVGFSSCLELTYLKPAFLFNTKIIM